MFKFKQFFTFLKGCCSICTTLMTKKNVMTCIGTKQINKRQRHTLKTVSKLTVRLQQCKNRFSIKGAAALRPAFLCFLILNLLANRIKLFWHQITEHFDTLPINQKCNTQRNSIECKLHYVITHHNNILQCIIKSLALFKLSLLLKSYLQRTQHYRLIKTGKYFTKVIKTKQRSLACFRWIESNEEKRKHFN